ncbi:hypothetical protein KP509_31G015300 [Ceratopteris richardii]|uniref:Uncharacterized protein n=1 Tax=Ceratopteris richardii TaxID=49495 RepID=A0A8T2QX35_CERRI|nr:hypothetical protein KP509_31G015300 [Ceratopteris richardii]
MIRKGVYSGTIESRDIELISGLYRLMLKFQPPVHIRGLPYHAVIGILICFSTSRVRGSTQIRVLKKVEVQLESISHYMAMLTKACTTEWHASSAIQPSPSKSQNDLAHVQQVDPAMGANFKKRRSLYLDIALYASHLVKFLSSLSIFTLLHQRFSIPCTIIYLISDVSSVHPHGSFQ